MVREFLPSDVVEAGIRRGHELDLDGDRFGHFGRSGAGRPACIWSATAAAEDGTSRRRPIFWAGSCCKKRQGKKFRSQVN